MPRKTADTGCFMGRSGKLVSAAAGFFNIFFFSGKAGWLCRALMKIMFIGMSK